MRCLACINYPRRVYIQTRYVTRCQLYTQSIHLNATFGEASTIHGKYSRNWHSNGTFNYLHCIRLNARARKMSPIHSGYPFKHNFWQGVYYACKVLSQLAFERNIHLSTQSIRLKVTSDEMSTVHAEYLFECYF